MIIMVNGIEKELEIIGENGVEYTEDLLGNYDALHYDKDKEQYIMTEDEFAWWEPVVDMLKEIDDLENELDEDARAEYDSELDYFGGFELKDEMELRLDWLKNHEKSNLIGEEKQRLFVDMDGTLAVFTPVDTLETLYEQRYFADLKPIAQTLEAVKEIIKNSPEVEVYILSAYLADSDFALREKNEWLDRHLPEIPAERRIFSPCGSDKKDYIPEGIRATDCLLDDYTKNLLQWQPPGKGIKLLNGINHTKGTWQDDRIYYKKASSVLAKNILDVMKDKRRIYDQKPIVPPQADRAPKL